MGFDYLCTDKAFWAIENRCEGFTWIRDRVWHTVKVFEEEFAEHFVDGKI